jgi:DNA-binding NarL/FixJ family response regulator
VVGELVAHGASYLLGEEARVVAEVAGERVAVDVAAAARAHAARSPRAIRGPADLGRGRARGWTPRLTSNEYGLLQLAHAGWDKPELAFLTGVDEPTLRRRLDNIMAKLGADDLAEGVRIARARNIVR